MKNIIFTTTPKRNDFIRDLVEKEKANYTEEQFNKDLNAKHWDEIDDATAFIRYMRGYDDE